MGRLDGKIAIITGAASGIGQATARRVAAEGARTVVADLNAAGAKQVADEIAAAGGDATAVQVDLGDSDSVRAMVEAAVTAYGGLDILHNNAAATQLAATKDLPVSAADPDVWDETMRINLRGTMVAVQAAVPHLIARGGGSVINTASGAGLSRRPAPPGLRRVQGRADQPDPLRGDGVRQAGGPVQRDLPRLHRDQGEARPRGGARHHAAARAYPPARPARRTSPRWWSSSPPTSPPSSPGRTSAWMAACSPTSPMWRISASCDIKIN